MRERGRKTGRATGQSHFPGTDLGGGCPARPRPALGEGGGGGERGRKPGSQPSKLRARLLSSRMNQHLARTSARSCTPGTREAKAGGQPEPRSPRPAWATQRDTVP